MHRIARRHWGFTLIELLVVIAIILILIAIALPNLIEARMRSQVVHAYGEMKAITEAEDTYFLDHRTFTDDFMHYGDSQGNSLTTPIRYITAYPIDPFQKFTNQTLTIPHYRIGTGNAKVSRDVQGIPAEAGCSPLADRACKTHSERHPFVADSMMVLSKGPDDRDSGGPIPMFPHPVKGGWLYQSYSLTNGTYSEGDMYRLTGFIPQSYKHLIGN
jgi:prepilin-type N-terminal cleavage/methylation domain-containing protein